MFFALAAFNPARQMVTQISPCCQAGYFAFVGACVSLSLYGYDDVDHGRMDGMMGNECASERSVMPWKAGCVSDALH